MSLLDFLFPKYCVSCRRLGSYLCADCFSFISFDTEGLCLACNRPSVNGLTHPGCRGMYVIDGSFTAITYKRVVKKLIYQFKYEPYLAGLGQTLTELFFESLIQKEQFDKACQTKPMLVPIPLHSSKLRTRGYNQAKILSEGLGKKLNLPISELLKRTKKTKSQYGLDKKARKKNMANAFSLSPLSPRPWRGSPPAASPFTLSPSIFLVDDILTTGSTMLEAARVLKRNGAKKVWGLALARD